MIVSIENIISEGLITLELKASSKRAAIAELAEMLFREGKLESLTDFIDSVNKREAMMSTYCGFDVAIPHAKGLFVKEPSFAFARSKGFLWGKEDGNVNFVFLLAIPEVFSGNSSNLTHIGLISLIAELALEKQIRDKWAMASTKQVILETFKCGLVNKINI